LGGAASQEGPALKTPGQTHARPCRDAMQRRVVRRSHRVVRRPSRPDGIRGRGDQRPSRHGGMRSRGVRRRHRGVLQRLHRGEPQRAHGLLHREKPMRSWSTRPWRSPRRANQSQFCESWCSLHLLSTPATENQTKQFRLSCRPRPEYQLRADVSSSTPEPLGGKDPAHLSGRNTSPGGAVAARGTSASLGYRANCSRSQQVRICGDRRGGIRWDSCRSGRSSGDKVQEARHGLQ
jgi:hypothetical protein